MALSGDQWFLSKIFSKYVNRRLFHTLWCIGQKLIIITSTPHMRFSVLVLAWSWWDTRFIVSLNFIFISHKKKNQTKKKNTHTHSHTPTTTVTFTATLPHPKRNPNQNMKNNIPFKTIPASMGLCLELAYPITSCSESRDDSMDSAPFRHQLPLNSFIDSILRTVYHASAPAPPPPTDPHGARRQIIFTSSSPDACAAVNWKQPNCQSHPPIFIFLFSSLSLFFFGYLALQSEMN